MISGNSGGYSEGLSESPILLASDNRRKLAAVGWVACGRPTLFQDYRDGMTLVAVETSGEPLVEWITPSLTVKRGRDPLGMQTITLDRIMPTLLPGVLALSERARYLAIYPFLLSLYEERRLAADNASLGEFIRLREYELCLAMQMCPRCTAAKAIGSERARPDARLAVSSSFGPGLTF